MNEIKHYGVKGMRWGVRRKLSELRTRISNYRTRRKQQSETNILSKTKRLRAENDLYGKIQNLKGSDRRYAKRLYKKRNRLTNEELDSINRTLSNKVAYNQELDRFKQTKKNSLGNTIKRVGTSTAVNLAVQKLSGSELNVTKALKDASINEGVQRLKDKGVDPKLAEAIGKATSKKMSSSSSNTESTSNKNGKPTSEKTAKQSTSKKVYMEGEILPSAKKQTKPKEKEEPMVFDGEFEEITPKKQYKTLNAPPAILGLPMPKR